MMVLFCDRSLVSLNPTLLLKPPPLSLLGGRGPVRLSGGPVQSDGLSFLPSLRLYNMMNT